MEYSLDSGPWDPFSAFAHALVTTFTKLAGGIVNVPAEAFSILSAKEVGLVEKTGHAPEQLHPPQEEGLTRSAVADFLTDGSLQMGPTNELDINNISTAQAFRTLLSNFPAEYQSGNLIAMNTASPHELEALASRSMSHDTQERLPSLHSTQTSRSSRKAKDASLSVLKGLGEVIVNGVRAPIDATVSAN